MTQPLAFINGKLVPAEKAVVPVQDAGFIVGATVAEQLRTFRGKLFQLERHLDRLMRSLEIVGVDPGFHQNELGRFANELTDHNYALLDKDDDLGLSIFVTPGPYATFAPSTGAQPMVGMHTYLQPFHLWSDKYETGQSLMITDVRQVPSQCWPAELKCRSRMHYYLADRQARLTEAGSRALLLDLDGRVMEASTASVVIYVSGEGLVAPPAEKILPGISIMVLTELAETLQVSFSHRDLGPQDVASADEVLLCSTSPCLLPVTRLNGRPIGNGKPGDVFRRALGAWSDMVGLDIRAQSLRFARRL